MPLIIVFISSFFLLPTFVQAKAWNSPSISTENTAQLLDPGTTQFSLRTTYEQYSRRFTSSGEKVRLSRLGQQPIADTKDVEIENYFAKVKKTTVVPQWTNGIMPGWTIGAQLPIVILQYDKTFSDPKDSDKETVSRLGNVELMSKELLSETNSSKIVFLQRIQFPSAEYERTENEIQHSQFEENYVLGVGIAFEKKFAIKWAAELAAIYNYTFNDEIDLKSTGEKVSRDPGDETLIISKIKYHFTPRISSDAGVLWGQKFKDKIKNNAPGDQDTSSMQTVAEANVGYMWPQVDEFSLSYATKLKFQKSLSGRNTEDISALGFDIEMMF